MANPQVNRPPASRQQILAFALLLLGPSLAACSAPISTMRSPYHLRIVEIRNATADERMLTVVPVAGQQLGAATTFTGLLKPGEVKVLYLYHGFEYRFAIREGHDRVTTATVVDVDRDLGLEFGGDSLEADPGVLVRLGDPEVVSPASFSDSLMQADPFGLRDDSLLPDTTRGQALPVDADERRRVQQERELEEQRSGRKQP